MQPKQIKVKDEKLILVWSESEEWQLPLSYLRDECPCAGCKGETVLFKTYIPEGPTATTPEAYKIVSIQPVGGYAIQINWKDGHDSGIYSWGYLKQLHETQQPDDKQQYDSLL
jgi:DUF971 family protein